MNGHATYTGKWVAAQTTRDCGYHNTTLRLSMSSKFSALKPRSALSTKTPNAVLFSMHLLHAGPFENCLLRFLRGDHSFHASAANGSSLSSARASRQVG